MIRKLCIRLPRLSVSVTIHLFLNLFLTISYMLSIMILLSLTVKFYNNADAMHRRAPSLDTSGTQAMEKHLTKIYCSMSLN